MNLTVRWLPACLLFAAVAGGLALIHAQSRQPQPGDPLPGITADEFELFHIGLEDFLEVETAGEGLGPSFNGLSCAQCHATPAVGGISPVSEVRVGRVDGDGGFYVGLSLPESEACSWSAFV